MKADYEYIYTIYREAVLPGPQKNYLSPSLP